MAVKKRIDAVVVAGCALIFVTSACLVLDLIRQQLNDMDSLATKSSKNQPAPGYGDGLEAKFLKTNFEVMNGSLLSEVFAQRKWLLRRECKRHFNAELKYYNLKRPSIWKQHYGNFLVDDVHKVVFCAPPQFASKAWRLFSSSIARSNALLNNEFVAVGGGDGKEELGRDDGKGLKPIYDYTPDALKAIIQNYTKIAFVMNPLDRLYSAWLIESTKRSPESLGWKIIQKFRMNGRNTTGEEIKKELPVNLQEYLAYYIESQNGQEPRISQLVNCDLCIFPFDYVGRFENLAEEADYLVKEVVEPQRNSVEVKLTGQTKNGIIVGSVIEDNKSAMTDDLNRVNKHLLLAVGDDLKREFQLLGYDLKKTMEKYFHLFSSVNKPNSSN